jgi:small conductance mechanosensitive channel
MDLDFLNKGIEQTLDKLEGWGVGAIEMLPNLLIALVVVFVFWGLSKWAKKTSHRAFSKSHFNESLSALLGTVFGTTVLVLGAVLALGVLDLQKTVMSLLAGVGVIGLALGFAFRDLAANFMSGIMLAVRSPINIGDVVEINGVMGTVQEVRIRDTIVRNFDGQDVFIPNKEFTSNYFTNYSSFGKRKITISTGIGYEDDVKKGLEIFKKALTSVDGVLSDPEPTAYAEELGGSSVNLKGRVWIKYPGSDYLKIQNDLYVEVKTQLDSEGFNIPFPIRTLDIPDKTLEAFSQMTPKHEAHSDVKNNSKRESNRENSALQ